MYAMSNDGPADSHMSHVTYRHRHAAGYISRSPV